MLPVNIKRKKIAREIFNFFQSNPDSKATLEDIVKWLLPLERIDLSVDVVAEVVEELFKEGLLTKVMLNKSLFIQQKRSKGVDEKK